MANPTQHGAIRTKRMLCTNISRFMSSLFIKFVVADKCANCKEVLVKKHGFHKSDNMAPIIYVEAPHSLWGKETRVLLNRAPTQLRLSESTQIILVFQLK